MSQTLSPTGILVLIAGYFLLLYLVSLLTGRRTDNATFFLAGRRTHWIWIAIGMIGASLSGVTFISIPGVVGTEGLNRDFSYFQVVLGYLLGYAVIALVLLPLYYRLNLTTIYGYLRERFGFWSYKTGAAYFLLSRVIGSAFRLFLVAMVLDRFVVGPMGVPFWVTVLVSILLIWVYTRRSGMQTIIFTDVLQTVFMLLAVALTIVFINEAMGHSGWDWIRTVRESGHSRVFFWSGGWEDPNYFFKQFLSGALITIVMTGLDQDMMQKNLACRSLRDAQKNMFTFCLILVVANLLFLSLGALLHHYAAFAGIAVPERTDQLYPLLALEHLPAAVGIFFIIGLIAAAYSSADSALTALTTSFCVDFLGVDTGAESGVHAVRTRRIVHIGMSVLMFFVILAFSAIHNEAVITKLFEIAGYTYGPLLGLFAFGLATRRRVLDHWVIPVALAAPVLTYVLNANSAQWFGGLKLGFLLIAVNGVLMFAGLWAISRPFSVVAEGRTPP
ncbi:MAG: sodium:solute symporter [Saprospiraceae bacterium]|nr:sodium:solute symporter [Saprospiraceae bacterium]